MSSLSRTPKPPTHPGASALLFSAVTALAIPIATVGQESTGTLERIVIPHLNGEITLDGRVGEAAWEAVPVCPATMHTPNFGRTVILELNRLRMVVDVSHTSDQAVRDVLSVSAQPVTASHSCCRELCDHARNLPDELTRTIAERGGVGGINFYSAFVGQGYLDMYRAKHEDALTAMNKPVDVLPADLDRVARQRLYLHCIDDVPCPPFDSLLDQIDRMVEIAGIDHVGLETDLDVPHLSTPEGFDDVTDFPLITEGLLARGYPAEDVRKNLGSNFLRVLDEVAEA